MRIVIVWCLGIFLIASIMISWYVSQPLLLKLIGVSTTIMEETGQTSTESQHTFTIVGYFANLWPVPLVLIILLWMFISGQREDPYSKLYG